MKKYISPLIFLLKKKETLQLSTQNASFVANKFVCYQQNIQEDGVQKYVEKQMKQYPIVVRSKPSIPWELIRPDEKVAQLRKSKVWLISKIIQDLAMNASYHMVQDARDIVKSIKNEQARGIKSALQMLKITVKDYLNSQRLEEYVQDAIYALLTQIKEVQAQKRD